MKQTTAKEVPTIRITLPNGMSRHLTLVELGLMAGCAVQDVEQANPEALYPELTPEGLRLIGEAAIQIVENEDYSVNESSFPINDAEDYQPESKQPVVLH